MRIAPTWKMCSKMFQLNEWYTYWMWQLFWDFYLFFTGVWELGKSETKPPKNTMSQSAKFAQEFPVCPSNLSISREMFTKEREGPKQTTNSWSASSKESHRQRQAMSLHVDDWKRAGPISGVRLCLPKGIGASNIFGCASSWKLLSRWARTLLSPTVSQRPQTATDWTNLCDNHTGEHVKNRKDMW